MRYDDQAMIGNEHTRRSCRMNLLSVRLIWLALFPILPGFAQSTAHSYMKRAEVTVDSGKTRIVANSPRPLEQALDALQQKYGWIINYEDPRYTSPVDLIDAPDQQKTTRVPAGGSFSVEIADSAKTDSAKTDSDKTVSAKAEEKMLRAIIEAYNRSQNPGRFEIRTSAQGEVDVVGAAAHDAKGGISQQEVLFDLPIALPSKERTLVETAELICQQLTEQGQVTVTLGVYPRSTLGHTPVTIGGAKAPARDLLRQCLQAAKRKLYWQLIFDPEAHCYFLNIHGLL